MSDFAGEEYEFAAGSLHGLRGWGMDESGRLHGVTHKEVWRPGENVSECRAQYTTSPCPGPRRSSVAIPRISKKTWFGRDVAYPLEPASLYDIENHYEPCKHPRCDMFRHYDERGDGHHFDRSCSCGFWAYDEASFAPQGVVLGVIEAYGKTTIGTKGFRAEKARIVGLCRIGAGDKVLSHSVQSRLSMLYPEVKFHETHDDMVLAHASVLKNWPAVEDGFWDTKVPQSENHGPFGGLMSTYYPQYYISTSPSGVRGIV